MPSSSFPQAVAGVDATCGGLLGAPAREQRTDGDPAPGNVEIHVFTASKCGKPTFWGAHPNVWFLRFMGVHDLRWAMAPRPARAAYPAPRGGLKVEGREYI